MEPEETQTPAETSDDVSDGGYVFRNHPQVIVDNVIGMLVVLAFIFLMNHSSFEDDPKPILMIIAALVILITAYSFLVWKRTVYEFTSEEIKVSRVALSKSEKRIRYDRIASVGINRTVTNRIFGTSTLLFNVNSSVNAATAEAKLVLPKDQADRLRDRINSRMFGMDPADEVPAEETESMVKVTNGEIIMHSLVAQSTAQAIYGIVMLIYAVISTFTGSSGGLLMAVVLLVFGEVYPMIRQIMKYWNYRIYRVGDKITVECGLISKRRSSFKINKINSVRIRSPLIARALGGAVLEAEVVGLADEAADNIPLLCPLKRRSEVEDLLGRLVPELVFTPGVVKQPRAAIVPMVITDIIMSALVILFFGGIIFYVEAYVDILSGFWMATARLIEVCALVIAPVLIFGHSGLAQRNRGFDMGPESFLFVYGAYDLNHEYINYDKVQYTDVRSGPVQRIFGVSRCSVYMMSSSGYKSIKSGIFAPEDLEKVSGEVMDRIRDGRYDYRRYY